MLSYFRNVRAALTKRDRGASAVEYGLMVAAIAAIIVAIVFALGKFVQDGFDDTCEAMKTGNPGLQQNCP